MIFALLPSVLSHHYYSRVLFVDICFAAVRVHLSSNVLFFFANKRSDDGSTYSKVSTKGETSHGNERSGESTSGNIAEAESL